MFDCFRLLQIADCKRQALRGLWRPLTRPRLWLKTSLASPWWPKRRPNTLLKGNYITFLWKRSDDPSREADCDFHFFCWRTSRLKLTKEQITFALPTMDVRNTVLADQCPLEVDFPCQPRKYRAYNGYCNNVQNPRWGNANTRYLRFLPPDYSDGKKLAKYSWRWSSFTLGFQEGLGGSYCVRFRSIVVQIFIFTFVLSVVERLCGTCWNETIFEYSNNS